MRVISAYGFEAIDDVISPSCSSARQMGSTSSPASFRCRRLVTLWQPTRPACEGSHHSSARRVSQGSVSGTSRSAAAMSLPSWKRSAGSFSRHFMMIASSPDGIGSSVHAEGGLGVVLTCSTICARPLSVSNTSFPVASHPVPPDGLSHRREPLLESRSASRHNAPFGEQPRPARFIHLLASAGLRSLRRSPGPVRWVCAFGTFSVGVRSRRLKGFGTGPPR